MKGNLLGEQFNPRVSTQIGVRQQTHGSGLDSSRNVEQINYLNNRNAWLKMASSVYVVGDTTNDDIVIKQKTGKKDDDGADILKKFNINTDVDGDNEADGITRLKDIGIPNPENFVGNLLAQQTVLFNTLSTLNPSDAPRATGTDGSYDRDSTTSGTYQFRSGVTNSNALWNNNSYGLGGTDFGLTPAPGLIDASIECVNRGSIRKAKVSLKAYNKFQFEILEMAYMRLGFSVMLEWGWDKYIANDGSYQQVENTIIEDKWFSQNGTSQVGMIEEIKKYRDLYDFNYDAFFGKVTNFSWTFNPDGTYDISLDLITIGDVIESLSVVSPFESITATALAAETKNGNWFQKDGPVYNTLGNSNDNNIVAGAGNNRMSYQIYKEIRDRNWDSYETEDDKKFFSWESANAETNGSGNLRYPSVDQEVFNFYMTFGKLMDFLQVLTTPTVNSSTGEARYQVEFDSSELLAMSAFPNMVSLDPKVCLIKPIFFDTEGDGTVIFTPGYFNRLKQCVAKNGDMLFARIMNIYINFEHIAKLLNGADKDGDLSMFKFLETLCKDINAALGGVCNLEPIIKDDYIITIIDQNPIPGLIPPDDSTPLEVFGYDTTNNTSNFVTDIKFTSKITPKYATQISIGATGANSKTKNQDSTAFSKWNKGLLDRFAASIVDAAGAGKLTDTEAVQRAWDEGKEVSNFKEGYNVVGNVITGAIKSFWNNPFKSLFIPGYALYQGGKYASKEQQEDGVAKNVTFHGTTYNNFEEVEWDEKAKRILQAEADAKANATQTFTEFKETYGTNYNLWLTRAFGGSTKIVVPIAVKGNNIRSTIPMRAIYTKMEDDFKGQGKSAFKAYMNTTTADLMKKFGKPSGKIGFIPVDLSLTLEGMSGMLLYNNLPIRQNFLPKQYDKALKFIITKVNHKISDNSWSTNLSTLATSPVETFPLGKAVTSAFSVQGKYGGYDTIGPISSDKAFRIIDKRNGKNEEVSIDYIVSQFNENVQPNFRTLFEALNSKYPGYTASINAIERTFKRSSELQNSGANASPGKSKHNYNAAVDMNITDPNGRVFMKKEREPWINSEIVSTAKTAGFLWGGNFSGYIDSIHFYYQFNINTAYQNAEDDNTGKPLDEWKTGNTKLT